MSYLIAKVKNKRQERQYARQRAKRGFSDYDVYEIGTWFMTYFPRMLEELRKHVSMIPNVVRFEYAETHPGVDPDHLDEASENAIMKEWDDLLVHTIGLCDKYMSEDGLADGGAEKERMRLEVLGMFTKYFYDLMW